MKNLIKKQSNLLRELGDNLSEEDFDKVCEVVKLENLIILKKTK